MKRSLAALFLVSSFYAGHAGAQSMRLVDGQPCYPTERTLYDKDGVTPFACTPAGGPSYKFKVFAGAKLALEASLSSDKPEIVTDLPDAPPLASSYTKLTVFRCLDEDPTGHSVFVGVKELLGFESLESGENKISLPHYANKGRCIHAKQASKDYELAFDILGPDDLTLHYRVLIRNE
jgi:hypothetical protein